MALFTTLKLEDIQYEYRVTDFCCHYARRYNRFTPESVPTCERIEVTVVAPETDDYTIYEWYIYQSVLSGKLTYELPVSPNHSYSELRTIEFIDARCFAFSESYDIDAQSRRLLKVMMVPGHVKIADIGFSHL